jgi:hypothetical protein
MTIDDSITKDLLHLENKYWTAMVKNDLNTALRLTDFPCVIAGCEGARLVDEKNFKEIFSSMENPIQSFEIQNPEARMLSPDTAIIAYTIQLQNESKEHKAVDASTWIRRSGEWRCAMHTEAEAKPNRTSVP